MPMAENMSAYLATCGGGLLWRRAIFRYLQKYGWLSTRRLSIPGAAWPVACSSAPLTRRLELLRRFHRLFYKLRQRPARTSIFVTFLRFRSVARMKAASAPRRTHGKLMRSIFGRVLPSFPGQNWHTPTFLICTLSHGNRRTGAPGPWK